MTICSRACQEHCPHDTPPPAAAVPDAGAFPDRVLRVGDDGDDVRVWQEFLATCGWHISQDGKFGETTKRATVCFQEIVTWKKQTADGIPGPLTFEAAALTVAHGHRISPNFKPREFACKGMSCGCRHWIRGHHSVVEWCEKIRTKLGEPFAPHSAHRCPAHNKKEGGSKTSQHMYGRAIDINRRGEGITPRWAISEGFTRGALGVLDNKPVLDADILHLDTRDGRAGWLYPAGGGGATGHAQWW